MGWTARGLVRTLASLLAALSALGPRVAVATAPDDETVASPEDPRVVHARQLYREGEARFATADYTGAIELWTQAFSSVPDASDAARVKALLIYNLATAHERAHAISGEIGHLKQAKVLLESYAAGIPSLFGDTPEADDERAKVTGRLDALVRAIEIAERDKPRRAVAHDDDRPDRAPADQRADGRRRGRALVITGATLTAIGVAGLAVMGSGLVIGARANDLGGIDPTDIAGRRDRFERGRSGNTMAIAGGVIGGVALVGGAALLGVGLARARRTAMAPAFAPGYVGVGLRHRF